MHRTFNFLVRIGPKLGLALMLLTLPRCYNPTTGATSEASRTELDGYADRFIDVEKKYLKAAELLALLLEEAAAMEYNETAKAHIRKFASDNELALNRIGREFDGWQKHVNHDDLMAFEAVLLSQPYAKKLDQLVPAFKRRFGDDPQFLAEFDELMDHLRMHR